jgi:AcrR family transcriptional regulator
VTRQYDSSRRAAAAAKTRADIVTAAVMLHGQGILDIEAVAKQAGVSMATVRKHFPTREDLFRGCTGVFLETVEQPAPEVLAAIPDPYERLSVVVDGVFAIQADWNGQMFQGYVVRAESHVVEQVVAGGEAYTWALVDALMHDWQGDPDRLRAVRGLAFGLLSTLGYRALRTLGGLTQDEAVAETIAAIANAMGIGPPSDRAGRTANQ